MMNQHTARMAGILVVTMGALVAAPLPAIGGGQPESDTPAGTKIFSGEPRLLIVHGYSTSAHWWAFLQRKIDRHMGGAGRRVVEVQLCNKGGTPIARWMNLATGERSRAWKQMLTPMIQAERGKRPVVVLCQQSLQWVYGERSAGIRSEQDRDRIQRGSKAIEQYAALILEDGAAEVMIAMHIYKRGMEPQIGNERLALAALMTAKPARLYAGPDVWTPTRDHYPVAFDRDQRHPNFIGAEIMAHYWFAALLEHDGLDVPPWSRREMDAAIADKRLGTIRDAETFRELLAEWKITSRRGAAPGRAGPVPKRLLDRYDKDGDGRLNERERAAFERARARRREGEKRKSEKSS